MKIFLADLVHDWEKVSLWVFPLNVGYIGAYAQKQFPDVEVRLFKRPQEMLDAIRTENPDVVGLAYYVWNANLNNFVMAAAKAHNPNILTVGGGPMFTDANRTQEKASAFFRRAGSIDAYVYNQGEKGFVELIRAFRSSDGNVEKLKGQSVPGTLLTTGNADDSVSIGEPLDIIRDLDEIPSPYLNGMLDSFFDEPFVPIMETNRSCPYRCTFCAWGIGTGKLARFSEERIFAEIDYIATHCTRSSNLMFADANFSILERDVEIGSRLKNWHDKVGYPGHVAVQWNKTRPDRVLRVARAMGGLTEVGASMQSLNPDVLAAIKRRNLALDDVIGMLETLRNEEIDLTLFSELIIGLPNETSESHLDANRKLMDLGAEIFNYNLHLLPGTEMDTDESRDAYFTNLGWRLHDNAYGIYDGEKIFEGQEVVLGTTTMPTDELLSFRFIHFLIQFMWSRKWYFDFLQLFKQAGVDPIDVIVAVEDAIKNDPGEIGELHARFKSDHALEKFETFDNLAAYWSRDENMERLRTGAYGKLNYQYTSEILLSHQDAFNQFLENLAGTLITQKDLPDPDTFMAQVIEVLAFGGDRRVVLTEDLTGIIGSKRNSFNYDLLAWREAGYEGAPAPISTSDRFEFEFYLPEAQRRTLQAQLDQFRTANINQTLRKMSEEISAETFFYKVRRSDSPTDESQQS